MAHQGATIVAIANVLFDGKMRTIPCGVERASSRALLQGERREMCLSRNPSRTSTRSATRSFRKYVACLPYTIRHRRPTCSRMRAIRLCSRARAPATASGETSASPVGAKTRPVTTRAATFISAMWHPARYGLQGISRAASSPIASRSRLQKIAQNSAAAMALTTTMQILFREDDAKYAVC
jgi:hypothetical protein